MSVIDRVHTLADEHKLKDKDTNRALLIGIDNKDITYNDDNTEHKKGGYTNIYEQTNEQNIIEKSDTGYTTRKSESNFIADSISELTISQKSRKETAEENMDIFEDSTLEDATELESMASINENNNFYDTSEYPNNRVNDSKTETQPPCNDLREKDEDSTNQNILNKDDEFQSELESFDYALNKYKVWYEFLGE